jgi:membrane-bound serine protease (ClpP class)
MGSLAVVGSMISFKSHLGGFLVTALVWSSGSASAACTMATDITGTIGPSSVDLVERTMNRAIEQNCKSIFLRINTPGGTLPATRMVVEALLNSSIPVLCLVAPSGGHAGSAGAIILQACHVNGAMVGTNLGAATPIVLGGEQMPDDLRSKIINDTRSWLESITNLRGRSKKFGEDIIVKAKAVSADEALRLGAIDSVVSKQEDFLKFANGREVKLSDNKTDVVETGPLIEFGHDLRFRALELLADPETAYLLLMLSLALIYFEITHPGGFAAGVLGGIGLIVALIALQKLNVEWGGLSLLLLGLALLIAEAFVPSFGALGVGGLASFILGSLFLFDPLKTGGYRLPLLTILPTAFVIAGAMMTVAVLVWRSNRRVRRTGMAELEGLIGRVVESSSPTQGQIEINGEVWQFVSTQPVRVDAKARVTGFNGLTLTVQNIEEA